MANVVLALAWWVILRRKETADDYFLAGRNLGWFVVGASIFASNIGSEHLVGLAGSGAMSGVDAFTARYPRGHSATTSSTTIGTHETSGLP